jgi:hypothetical protein
MNKDNPFIPMAIMAEAQRRTVEVLGVPFADPFNEEGVIVDVNDPKKLGRVKVTTSDDITSDWIPVNGSNSGALSARYLGAKVLVGKTNGRSENMYVIGISRTDPEIGITGNPVQLPILDESVGGKSDDIGMKCNAGNSGRMYILSNEMNEDVVVCLRRTNKQVGNKDAWAWKSVTSGLWVEKGVNPGNESTLAINQAQVRNPGIPECTEAFLGEVHEFTEDRGFRTTTLVCRRDENKNFSWMPISAPPVVFRSILPKCTETVHGMEAVLDDGNNSEFMVCQRYQGLLRWVRQGRRIPHKFYSKEKPLSRIQFTSSYGPVPSLDEGLVAGTPLGSDIPLGPYTPLPAPGFVPVPGGNLPRPNLRGLPGPDGKPRPWGWLPNLLVKSVPEINDAVLAAIIPDISLTGTDPTLKKLLQNASLIPATAFNGAQTIQKAAREVLLAQTGLPVETIFEIIRDELENNNSLSLETGELLAKLGDAANLLVDGVVTGDIDSALQQIGRTSLQSALLSLEPRAASVMTALMSSGIGGAVDAAVAIGLDQLPPEVNKYAGPVINIAKDLLTSKYPASLGNILNSAAGGGLLSAVSGTINSAAGSGIVSPQLLGALATGLTDGSLGDIPKLFGSLSNLDAIVKTPAGLGSLPVLATTALGLVGQAGAMKDLLGGGGIGLDNLDNLIGDGFNAASTIVSGVKGLASVFGGGASSLGCPCDPKCRKTAHGEDSDGNNLVEKCGAMTANNANAATPTGNPLLNNLGPIALELGLKATDVGAELIPKNIRDVTGFIKTVARVKDMAEEVFSTRFADQTEKEAQDAYTAEAVEKGLKVIDNNITRVESVEKKLIDSMYNMLEAIVYNRKGSGRGTAIIPNLIRDVRENSQAVKDLYKFVKKLDSVKDGGSAGVTVTERIARAFQNIPDLQALNRLNRQEALRVLRGGVTPAYREWKTMNPLGGGGLGSYGPPLPDPYDNERTLFNRDRILAISLESKLAEDNSPPEDSTLLDTVLSPGQLQLLKSISGTDGNAIQLGSDILNGLVTPDIGETIAPEEGSTLYDRIVDREGQTNCE